MRQPLALIAAFAAFPGAAYAGSGNVSTKSGSAAAQPIAPLTLVHTAGQVLNFGRFTVGTAGTVVVNQTSGAGSTTGGVAFATGSATAMDFFVASGDPNRLLGIVTGSGTVTSGTRTMTFTTTPMLNAGFLPSTGSGYFTVGGTLNVAASQAPGTYNGSYSVTVTYQ